MKPPRKKPAGSGRKPKLLLEDVAAAIATLDGNIAAVARKFGVDRSSVTEFVGKHPRLGVILRDAREGMTDEAEASLNRAVRAGEAWAVCFYLKTQAKHRGYVERQEITGAGDEPVALNIVRKVVTVADRQPGSPPAPDAA